jgi:predicted nucleic acid-binding protein
MLDEGNLSGDIDIMIASITIGLNEILITNNISHFKGIPNLTYKDWMSL